MATGISDKVAIIGMGCTKFGERWDCGTEHLVNEAFQEALLDSGVGKEQFGAAWYGSAIDRVNVGNSALPASTALRLHGIPVTRVENMYATGTEALRGAAYALAAGAVDFALAIGAQNSRTRATADYRSHRAVRGRVARALWRGARESEARDGPRVLEEPSERREESQGAPAETRGSRDDTQCTVGGRTAGSV